EVRFRDISSVHHGVSSAVKNYFQSYGIKSAFEREKEVQEEIERDKKISLFDKIAEADMVAPERVTEDRIPQAFSDFSTKYSIDHSRKSNEDFSRQLSSEQNSRDFSQEQSSSTSRLAEFALSEPVQDSFSKNHIRFQTEEQMRFSIPGSSISARKESDFIYYGTLFGTFLMVQKKGIFYLIDQHAAHERILFNQLMQGGSEKQMLLVPYEIQTESQDEDKYMQSIQTALTTAGFKCENKGKGKWIFTSLPARWKGNESD
ncbi:MAG: hypothetical protein IJ727_01485, partial [Treponema sp.]|nr:hypothetical protein [Treponema sp.]